MALIKCEECGSIIPNGAKACPNCGCPIDEKTTSSFWQKLCKHFYTKDDDPYVDLAAKLTAVPKVVCTVGYILCVLFHIFYYIVNIVILAPFIKAYPIFWSVFLFPFFVYTLMTVGLYLFWCWVGSIIVNGIRKIRQSKNKQ